jgi:hypothetical protein
MACLTRTTTRPAPADADPIYLRQWNKKPNILFTALHLLCCSFSIDRSDGRRADATCLLCTAAARERTEHGRPDVNMTQFAFFFCCLLFDEANVGPRSLG